MGVTCRKWPGQWWAGEGRLGGRGGGTRCAGWRGGQAGSCRPGLLKGVQVGVTWPQRQLRSRGPTRLAGVKQPPCPHPQHAVYQQRVPAASPTEQHRFPSSGPRTLPVLPVLPVSLGSGASGKGHAPTSQMKTWRRRHLARKPMPLGQEWGSFLPSPCSLVRGFVSAAAPAPQPGS